MPTRSYAETMSRHSGPWLLVAWKPAPAGANRGLPLKYLKKPDGDPIAAAWAEIAAGAGEVDVWSTGEQQFATVVRAGDPGDAPPRAAVETEPRGGPAKGRPRGSEYAATPGAGEAVAGLPAAVREALAFFVERGSATAAELAAALGLSADVAASRATRLKGMGLLARER